MKNPTMIQIIRQYIRIEDEHKLTYCLFCNVKRRKKPDYSSISKPDNWLMNQLIFYDDNTFFFTVCPKCRSKYTITDLIGTVFERE